MLIYLVIILFGLARHEAKYQEYLFHAVSRADEGVDGKHLLPWVVDDLKGTIHIPCLRKNKYENCFITVLSSIDIVTDVYFPYLLR
jgi:hypothetical protein